LIGPPFCPVEVLVKVPAKPDEGAGSNRVDASGITYVTSYPAWHSFAAWSLIVGINPLRLDKLYVRYQAVVYPIETEGTKSLYAKE
jgi:hypothetical protein